jgi:erythromycin esterase-like protein
MCAPGLRPVSPEEEMLVRNLADAAGWIPKPSWRAIISRTNLPQQFDEYVWFDETRAVTSRDTAESLPETDPRREKRDVGPRPGCP